MDRHRERDPETALTPNDGKSLTIDVAGSTYARLPVRTHTVTSNDDAGELIERYVRPHLASGDTIFMSERVVAITQGRAIPIADIKPRKLAVVLSRYVTKTPAGIGVGSPWTMEVALREVGVLRILAAAIAAAITKPLGVRGVFYRIAGRKVAAIDGPCDNTLPPYNTCATLGPKDPDKTARSLAERAGVPVVIIDANDLGVNVLGASRGVDRRWAAGVFGDNPLGQGHQSTPLCIVRRVPAMQSA